METTYALSRNKRSSKWQFRKRCPSDVARILPAEFIKSAGEDDKRAAQARVAMIAAEYERRTAEALAKLAGAPPTTFPDAQALAMATHFYRSALPPISSRNPLVSWSSGSSFRILPLSSAIGRLIAFLICLH
ncbi:hypothetical protein [uncultured Sphingopyxis sp.]|uniref:hypothetical protein n=1 Tax=uncultured Sphingopyxis sp. TaxID=310581 RepID=UPI002594908B|nr:hypothetical protein [uncultured Sphingopyxis sp.]